MFEICVILTLRAAPSTLQETYMQPDSPAHLWDALEAARLARSIFDGSNRVDFSTDWILQAAVERKMEILGEALNRVRRTDVELASRIPHLKDIVATRNVIAHQYATVDQERVWETIESDVPDLIRVLDSLLAEYGPPRD